jgi:membrane associated rhomboid family serine protease
MVWVLWALVGWCGTPWPHRFRLPPPPPPPDPWWFNRLPAVIGGLLGGWVFNSVWPMTANMSGVDVAATAVGAFVGAVLLTDIVGLARGGSRS